MAAKLDRLRQAFSLVEDRSERIQMLIDIADRFREVPPEIASRPFDESRRVPDCESQAFVWSGLADDGGMRLHFAVENPQGISAKAMAVILEETLSGERPETVAEIPLDLPHAFFGRELSMGKTMGLMGMVGMVKGAAERLAGRRPG